MKYIFIFVLMSTLFSLQNTKTNKSLSKNDNTSQTALLNGKIVPILDTTDKVLKELVNQVNNYYKKLPPEKIYVHLDKPIYKPNETIWGKVYLLDANNDYASSISDVAYVDIINPRGQVEKTISLAVKNGVAQFDFDLTEVGGLYKLKAYTKWLQNNGEESFFERSIQVQKTMNPKLLLKIDFLQKSYGAGNEVEAYFEAKDLKKNTIINQPIRFDVNLAGKNILQQNINTDAEGKAIIRFKLPNELTTNDGLLNVMMSYDGYSESISRSIPIVLNKIDIQFMPEGGEALTNIDHKIAFKAVNEFGKGADIEGFIVDETNTEIVKIKSFHQGMGAFVINQKENKTYFAQIVSPFYIKIPLPKAKNQEYALMVDTLKNKVLQGKFYAPQNKTIYLTAQSGGKIFFSAKIKAKQGVNFFNFDTHKEKIGIAQITLFDEQKQPRAERLVFLNPDKKLKINIKTDKAQYLPREKVNVNIQTTDENNLPVAANLSLAAVNEQILNIADDKQDDMLSWLLLGTELKGKIDEPNFYFNPKEKKAIAALDFLMLTQGWRKFSWKNAQREKQYVKYVPEKNTTISGTIYHLNGMIAKKAQVVLFETGKNNKAAIAYTDENGKFLFLRTNPATPMQMMVKLHKDNARCQIVLDKQDQYLTYQHANNYDNYKYDNVMENESRVLSFNGTTNVKPKKTLQKDNKNDVISLQEETNQLSEVVVFSNNFDQVRNSSQTVTIVNKDILNGSLEQNLQGRIEGISVITGKSIATNDFKIRGMKSFGANAMPLYIVDGVEVDAFYFSSLNVENIDFIEILKNASATAMYGGRAANGVIVVSNKKTLKNKNEPSLQPINPYTSLLISNKNQNSVREFYLPKYDKLSKNENRNDFRSTVFWQGDINTDEKGQANVSFYNSDEITTFKLTAEGFGKGLIGHEETSYFTLKPLQIDIKMPPFLTVEDTLQIPVYLRNNVNEVMKANLQIKSTSSYLLLPSVDNQNITLQPNEKRTILLSVIAKGAAKNQLINISFVNEFFNDNVTQSIDIQQKGFPVEYSFSGSEKENTFDFELPRYLEGSLEGKVVVYTDVTKDLMNAVEGIIREPYGCFEQVSSSTYPNILALQLMNETGKIKPDVKKTALTYIANGYKKLAAYEISSGGFDWFGQAPAHEALSAFGLVEFLDMQKVYDGVDNKMIERTKKWLLSRKDGKGGFLNGKQDGHEVGNLPIQTKNAFIVYALARAKVKDIQFEYETTFKQALQSEDAYQMALLASASLDLDKVANANILLEKLRTQLNNISKMKVQNTWTHSGGVSKQIEAVSFTGVSLIRNKEKDIRQLSEIVQYLNQNRSYGMFGSTQGTVTALQYITDYIKFTKANNQNTGQIELWNGKELLASSSIDSEKIEVVELTNWVSKLKVGKHQLKIKFKNTEKALPFSIQLKYNSYTPNSQQECAIDLKTDLNLKKVKVNETVRLTTTITNKKNEPQPMTLAYVGIPSGLIVQAWQLKELQEKKVFDFYELRQNYVVFYYRSLKEKESKVIHLDLTAKIPGTFLAPAGAAYLYYTKELKDWEGGQKVVIEKP